VGSIPTLGTNKINDLRQFRFPTDLTEYFILCNSYVEDAANGAAVTDVLKKEIHGIIPVKPLGGKVVRAHAVTAVVEAGNVFIPDASVAPWVHDFIE